MEREWTAHAMVNRTYGGTVHAWNGQHRAAVIGTGIFALWYHDMEMHSSSLFCEIAFMLMNDFTDYINIDSAMAWCSQPTKH